MILERSGRRKPGTGDKIRMNPRKAGISYIVYREGMCAGKAPAGLPCYVLHYKTREISTDVVGGRVLDTPVFSARKAPLSAPCHKGSMACLPAAGVYCVSSFLLWTDK
jgi:hypothetical protein